MDRRRLERRWSGWLMALAVLASCGCQTVKTPEEKIANSNLPAEFTKVSMPEYVVEPPDLLIVEVLEALPGRPITGERLVRPDGKITLGFYGEVYVAGLTTTEIKEKIVLHLRKFLPDEVLGLSSFDPKTDQPRPVEPRDTDRVFVDVTAYNSKVYYVQGDVAQPGRLPITGNETVLDAIN
jgi:polysaccharide biosynthesis/export protein